MSIQHIWPALAVLGGLMAPSLQAQPKPAASTLTPIYAFQGSPDGAYPLGGVVADSNGSLYGVTINGGATNGCGCGTVYQLTNSGGGWSSSVLYSFMGSTDGGGPRGPLVFDKSGNLYGAANYGADSSGVVFQLLAPTSTGGPWTERVLYTFTGGDDGSVPNGGLVFDSNGVLYGSAVEGGTYTAGTIFSLTPPAGGPDGLWSFNLLYTFTGGSFGSMDGSGPNGNLVFGRGGELYGTTSLGGDAGSLGTIFRLARPAMPSGAWTEKVLYDFPDTSGGSLPEYGLIASKNGALYGTTPGGSGSSLYGTVFELAPPAETGGDWVYTTLANFGSKRGISPNLVTLNASGGLDGTTYGGGSSNEGVVFQLKPTTAGNPWKETVLNSFSGAEGYTPNGSLLRVKGGELYGVAEYGGDPDCNCGTVYEVIP